MNYSDFLQKLDKLAKTTDVPITPEIVAQLLEIPIEISGLFLQQALFEGYIALEETPLGMVYIHPNRKQLKPSELLETSELDKFDPGQFESKQTQDNFDEASPPRNLDTEQLINDKKSVKKKNLVRCPFCKEWIKKGALKCKHCFEYLDNSSEELPFSSTNNSNSQSLVRIPTSMQRALVPLQPGNQTEIAAPPNNRIKISNLIIPGLAQLRAGRILSGLTWMALSGFAYALLIFAEASSAVTFFLSGALALHIMAILDSQNNNNKK